jgi:hypothetical protein
MKAEEIILVHLVMVIQVDSILLVQRIQVAPIAETRDTLQDHLEVILDILVGRQEVIQDTREVGHLAHQALAEVLAIHQAVDLQAVAAVQEEAVLQVLARVHQAHLVHVHLEVEDNLVRYEKVVFNYGNHTPLVV